MKKKEETYTLAAEATLPYIAFPDAQSYFDSLSMKDFSDWNDKLSNKDVPESLIVIALSIYMNETGNQGMSFTASEVEEICGTFQILVGMANCVREGTIQQTGRMLLSNDNSSSFKMTDAGVRSVENMLGRKK